MIIICAIFHSKPSNADFQYLIDNMRKRLTGWKNNVLNMTTKAVATKATFGGIPSHIMNYINFSAKKTNTIDKVTCNFI